MEIQQAQIDPLEDYMRGLLHELPEKRNENDPNIIFRVPNYVRDSCPEQYTPRMISIGPFHHGKDKLRAMEQNKWRYLRDFLTRNVEVNLNVYMQQMRCLETPARHCYGEIVHLSSDELVKTLLLDGCFILELMFKLESGERDALHIFGLGLVNIISDLLLVENQIPFFILEKLFNLVIDGPTDMLRQRFARTISIFSSLGTPFKEIRDFGPVVHLLHLYHKLLISDKGSINTQLFYPEWEPRPFTESDMNGVGMKYPASVLIEFGVKFKREITNTGALSVTFKNGAICIPQFRMDHNRKIALMNLVAFEQSTKPSNRHFSSFVTLMDMIIKKPNDVEILEEAGIIENFLSSTEDATSFFADISEWIGIIADDHPYAWLSKEVNRYCQFRWNTFNAKKRRDYFSNAINLTSFVGSMFSFVFTLTQTLVTYLAFKRGCN